MGKGDYQTRNKGGMESVPAWLWMYYCYTIKAGYLAERLRLRCLVSTKEGQATAAEMVSVPGDGSALAYAQWQAGLGSWHAGESAAGSFGSITSLTSLHLLVRVGGCRSGHLVAETKYPCCCSACGGSELVGGLLEEALPDHTIFPQEESSLALLAKCSSSYGIPDAVEGFTLNPYLMT